MKKRLLSLLLCILCLCTSVGCAVEQHTLLYQLTVGSTTYCVRGTGTKARQIVLRENGEVIWAKSVKVSGSVGAQDGTYGFEVLDLNFDGNNDFMIANNVAGDTISYLCWLWNPTSGTYEQSNELSGLCNIQPREDMKAIFAFTHTYELEDAYLDSPASSISADSTTKYVWKDGKLIPEIRATITYYSEFKRYCYSLAYYDEELGRLGDSDDRWLSPEEYKQHDWSFLYYFLETEK